MQVSRWLATNQLVAQEQSFKNRKTQIQHWLATLASLFPLLTWSRNNFTARKDPTPSRKSEPARVASGLLGQMQFPFLLANILCYRWEGGEWSRQKRGKGTMVLDPCGRISKEMLRYLCQFRWGSIFWAPEAQKQQHLRKIPLVLPSLTFLTVHGPDLQSGPRVSLFWKVVLFYVFPSISKEQKDMTCTFFFSFPLASCSPSIAFYAAAGRTSCYCYSRPNANSPTLSLIT